MILAYALLIGLAAYRTWRAFAIDKISERPREWLYERGEDTSHPVAWFFAELLSCIWCWGFWLSCLGAWLVSDVEGYDPVQFALLALAGSAIAGATHKAVDR